MDNNKSTSLLTLPDIFQGRLFRIPDYQRGYSWEQEHLADLKKDVESYYNKDYKHFTGTIVAAKDTNKDGLYYIVDGQQRIASLVMLMNAIYEQDPNRFQDIKELCNYSVAPTSCNWI